MTVYKAARENAAELHEPSTQRHTDYAWGFVAGAHWMVAQARLRGVDWRALNDILAGVESDFR